MHPKLKLIAAVALPLSAIGWAAFRPELLFVNKQVNEAQSTGSVIKQGSFESYAHETKGQAKIIQSGSQSVLRLDSFSTSNGPDVHVYLIKGTDSTGMSLKQGFIDLGEIKGNLGSQNYTIPANTNLAEYNAVTIWCKRFSVGFGGATLAAR